MGFESKNYDEYTDSDKAIALLQAMAVMNNVERREKLEKELFKLTMKGIKNGRC